MFNLFIRICKKYNYLFTEINILFTKKKILYTPRIHTALESYKKYINNCILHTKIKLDFILIEKSKINFSVTLLLSSINSILKNYTTYYIIYAYCMIILSVQISTTLFYYLVDEDFFNQTALLLILFYFTFLIKSICIINTQILLYNIKLTNRVLVQQKKIYIWL